MILAVVLGTSLGTKLLERIPEERFPADLQDRAHRGRAPPRLVGPLRIAVLEVVLEVEADHAADHLAVVHQLEGLVDASRAEAPS